MKPHALLQFEVKPAVYHQTDRQTDSYMTDRQDGVSPGHQDVRAARSFEDKMSKTEAESGALKNVYAEAETPRTKDVDATAKYQVR